MAPLSTKRPSPRRARIGDTLSTRIRHSVPMEMKITLKTTQCCEAADRLLRTHSHWTLTPAANAPSLRRTVNE